MKTNKEQDHINPIHFKTKLFKIGSWTILKLPETASAKLPSRAMTMVSGTINNVPFQTPLEPDGVGSHWFRLDNALLKSIKADVGDSVTLEIEQMKEWPDPEVPEDLKKALDDDERAHALWMKITPNARWDWVRWIRLTREAETRKKRIVVTCSKLRSGMRRPCCFNRNLCSEADVSKNWVLLSAN